MSSYNGRSINGIKLTAREKDVLACIVYSLDRGTDKEIARILDISYRTVEKHRQNIFERNSLPKDSIKSYIQNSNQAHVLFKRYLEILVQEEFRKTLNKISKLVKNSDITFELQHQNNTCLKFIEQSLQIAKVSQKKNIPKLHIKLLDEINAHNVHHADIIYISIKPLAQNYKNLTVLDCSSMERTYSSIFQILKILLPKENLDELILKFDTIKSNTLSENRYMKQDLTIEDKTNNTFMPKSLKKYLLLLIGLLGVGISLGYAISLQSKSEKISNAVKPVTYFINHVNECKEIKDRLAKYRKVSIVSVSGIGKTQLARMFVGLNKKDYDLIWFFDALEDIDAEMQKLALKINELEGKKVIPDDSTTKEIMIYLQNKDKWLLVFDNLRVQTNSKVQKFIEWENNGHIIFCSQDSTNLPHPLHLTSFSKKDSDALAKSVLADKDPAVVQFLTDNFKGHPMTIVLGAQIIDHTKGLSFDKYKDIILQDNSKVNNNIKIVLERIPSTARDLVQKIALINNQKFSLGMLKIISDNPDTLEQDMFVLSKFALALQTTPDKENPIFEMHDVIKSGVLMQNLPNEDILVNIIEKLTKAIPQSEEGQHSFFALDPTVRGNLEIILQNSERYKVPFSQILKLRSGLMSSYMSHLQYYGCEKMANWLINKESEGPIILNAADERVAYAKYNLDIGIYEDFSKANFKEALNRFEKANKIMQTIDGYPELKFDILVETAQLAIWGGDVKKSQRYIEAIDQVIQSNPSVKLDMFFYWFVQAKIDLVKGNYNQALISIQSSIDAGRGLPSGIYSNTVLSLKAEILNALQNFEEAYQISKSIYEQEIDAKEPEHEFHARIMIPLAEAESNINKTKEALKHINQACDILHQMQHDKDLIADSDYASALVVKGDILFKLNKSKEAVNVYLKAVEIFANRYGLNFGKTPNISYLLLQGMKAAEQVKDFKNLEYFQTMFKKYFTLIH